MTRTVLCWEGVILVETTPPLGVIHSGAKHDGTPRSGGGGSMRLLPIVLVAARKRT